MKSFKKLTMVLAAMSLTACGGGGGSGNYSTGGVYFTHAELAQDFVYRLKVDAGYDVSLVKTNTNQSDYIVVYDYTYGTYDAYDLYYYNPGEDIVNYIANHSYNFYYDLDPLGGNLYQDYYTGIIFEKTEAKSKDLQKMAALKEALTVNKTAQVISAEYGFSEERSKEVARLAYKVANAPKGSMTDRDYDNFAVELLGNSITDYKNAIAKSAQGDNSDLKGLLADAATVNGVTPEDVDRIVGDIFNGSAQN